MCAERVEGKPLGLIVCEIYIHHFVAFGMAYAAAVWHFCLLVQAYIFNIVNFTQA